MHATNDEVAEAFEAVRRFVGTVFQPGTLKYEQAIDRATTTFMNSVPKFKPIQGKPNSVTGYALTCVERSFAKICAKQNPPSFSIDEYKWDPDKLAKLCVDSIGENPLELLPAPLRDVCWLRSQGFNLVDTGLLLGVGHQTVKKRIEAARAILQA